MALLIAVGASLMSGCATWPAPTRSPHVGQPGHLGRCADLFARLDRRTSATGAVDAAYGRIDGYPHLRIDRFLASFGDGLDDEDAFAAWIDRLQALDLSARRLEVANLPDAALTELGFNVSRDQLMEEIHACGDLFKEQDRSDARSREHLRRRAVMQDEYIPLRRALGVYPLTKTFVLKGVERWHAEARESFSNTPPSGWRQIRYASTEPADPDAARRIVQEARRDALGIPQYSTVDQRSLFAAFAPIWEVDTRSDDDRIGTPVWGEDGRIQIDTHRPAGYVHLSFVRFGPSVLSQLNYIIWFPARPKTSPLDIYGGRLDGLTFRVTLNRFGEPLVYETIHNCGCYYKAFPTHRLRYRQEQVYAEPPLILKAPPVNSASQAVVVAMQSRTHYVDHLYPLPRTSLNPKVAIALYDYRTLRSLPRDGSHHRSMFTRHGLVGGTQRLERFILWPTGVLSPGAMRQWGRHAVAFVGTRHFDDPHGLERMFESNDPTLQGH